MEWIYEAFDCDEELVEKYQSIGLSERDILEEKIQDNIMRLRDPDKLSYEDMLLIYVKFRQLISEGKVFISRSKPRIHTRLILDGLIEQKLVSDGRKLRGNTANMVIYDEIGEQCQST